MFGIDAQADDMEGAGAPSDRYLHPIDEIHAGRGGNAPRILQAGHVIVVGQGEEFDTMCMGARRNIGRTQQTIGDMGMAVQIGFKHGGANSALGRV